jgi:hypothetical protein
MLKESDELLGSEQKRVLHEFVTQEGTLLNIWKKILSTALEDQNQRHVPYTFLVQVKALYIYENSSKDDDGDNAEPFSSSTGSFSKFTET